MCVQTLAEKAEKHTKIWGGKSMCQQPGIIISNQMQPS